MYEQIIWNHSTRLTIDDGVLSDFIKYSTEIGTVYLIVMVKSDEEEKTFKEIYCAAFLTDFLPIHVSIRMIFV